MKILGFEFTRAKRSDVPATVAKEVVTIEKKSFDTLLEFITQFKLQKNVVTSAYEESASVYKAIKAIADNVPQAELAFYKVGSAEETESQELSDLLDHPNPYQSSHDFIECLAGDFSYYGELFIRKVTSVGQVLGTRNLPASLVILCPDDVQEVIDQATNTLKGWRWKNIEFPKEEIIQIKTYNPKNRWRGARPLKTIESEVQLDYKSLQYNLRFIDNDATPPFYLSTEQNLTEDQRNRLQKWADSRMSGVRNAGKTAVFEKGITPKTLSKTHTEMEFMEQRRYARQEILGAFRVPAAILNVTEDLNYATIQGQMKIFWLYTLIPLMRKIEEGLNNGLVTPFDPKIYFAFKIDNIPAFQEDFKDKVATAKSLWDMGFTRNEINQKLALGFEDKDWGEFWWVGFGQVPADAESAMAGAGGGAVDPNADAAAKGRQDISAMYTWKSFIVKQMPIENRFLTRVRKHFNGVRSECLKALERHGAEVPDALVDWAKADEDLVKDLSPLIKRAIESGAEIAKDQLSQKAAKSTTGAAYDQYLKIRASKIVGINETVKRQIRKVLTDGVVNGDSIQTLADAVRGVFNTASARALTIARTETAGAVNGGSEIYYQESGVEKKRWVTAGDELVREAHRQVDGETVEVEDHFTNGLRFPGDQSGSAAEVINCRCTISPII